MRTRRGDAAFYGLLAFACIAAGTLAVRNAHSHSSPSRSSTGQAAVATTAVASRSHARKAVAGKTTAGLRTRAARAKEISLTIHASRGRSWIVVRSRSARGPVRYVGILEQGRTLVERGPALWTRIGAVANVDVRLDGRLVQIGRSALAGVLVSRDGVRGAAGPSGVVGS